MVTDILDFDNMIRGYIVKTVKEYYPDTDTSENSPFDDLFIKPVIKFSKPFINALSRLELKSNLSNAQYLTEEEMDEIGEGNYFTSRKKGSAASTILTLIFANLNLEDPDFAIKIPTGAIFSTNSEKEFQTASAIILTADDMQKGYNKNKFTYEIEIPVTAKGIGTSYNVLAGEIMFCNTFFSNSLVSSVNKVAVTNGKDQEGNIEYAERLKQFYLSRQLGTEPGYKNFILELFDEITDVYVSGYKDKYMQRDLLKVVEDSGEIVNRHVGGMVDIYLKGCIYDNNQTVAQLNNNILLIDCEFSTLTNTSEPKNSVKIINLTDSTKTVKIKEIVAVKDTEFFGENTGKIKVVIDNTDECSYHNNIDNRMKLVYSYISQDVQISDERYFNIGLTQVELESPAITVYSLTDVKNNTINDIDTKTILNKSGIAGTTNEVCFLTLNNEKFSDYYNGMPITINYTSNKTLRRLRDDLNAENNRIVTTDVIGREAIPVPVNIKFKVKPTSIYKNMDKKILETRIKASVVSFFTNYKMGDTVEESDLIGWLYTDPSVKEVIQYIALPFDVFYIPKSIDEVIPSNGTQLSSDGVLSIESIEYPILNSSKFEVTIINS